MAIGEKRGRKPRSTIQEQITGTWSEAIPDESLEEAEESINEESELKTAEFVRLITMVGRYPAGSIIPAIAFPALDNLLALGAVVYDFDAHSEFLAGNPEHIALLATIGQSAPQTIPRAPWINASASNLLGATYIPLLHTQQTFSQPTLSNVPEKVEETHELTVSDPFPDSSL